MRAEMKSHAVREFHRNETEADFHAEEIRNIGYTVVQSGLAPEELQAIRDKIDRIYSIQVRELGGEDALERINDAFDSAVKICVFEHDEWRFAAELQGELFPGTCRLTSNDSSNLS